MGQIRSISDETMSRLREAARTDAAIHTVVAQLDLLCADPLSPIPAAELLAEACLVISASRAELLRTLVDMSLRSPGPVIEITPREGATP